MALVLLIKRYVDYIDNLCLYRRSTEMVPLEWLDEHSTLFVAWENCTCVYDKDSARETHFSDDCAKLQAHLDAEISKIAVLAACMCTFL